jgi:hypothetical protein
VAVGLLPDGGLYMGGFKDDKFEGQVGDSPQSLRSSTVMAG